MFCLLSCLACAAKLFINFDPSTNAKQWTYYLNRMKKAATDYLGKIVVTYAVM